MLLCCVSVVLRVTMSKHTRNNQKERNDAHQNDDDDGNNVTPAPPKRQRASPRLHNWNTCCDIDKLPTNLKCSACILYDGSTRKKDRSSHTSDCYVCYQGWKRDVAKVSTAKKGHVQAIKAWMSKQENIDCDAAFDEPLPKPTKIAFASPTPTTPTTTTNALTPENEPTKSKVRLYEDTVRSFGRSVAVSGIPKTHSIVLTADLNRWWNDSNTLSRIRNKLQQKQHTATTMFSQGLWAIAMSACPALANSAAQFLFPIVFLAFFHDTGLFDKLELPLVATSFPSNWSFWKFTIHQAARDTIMLGHELKQQRICVAADKGNKKGIGHFAKVLSKWKRTGGVATYLLDIDASGGTSEECAVAIEASIGKLKDLEDDKNSHLLHGQTTDSGGGGTLQSLHNALKQRESCVPDDQHLIANCTIYSHQVGLKSAVETAFGTGALDKVNAMQLLHSVYRLQESIDVDEWRHMLHKSSVFVANYDPAVAVTNEASIDTMSAADRNRNAFLLSYNKVLLFHSKFNASEADPSGKYKGTTLAKQQQPILSRWWTVGSGASHTFDYFLVLFHACQTVVNMYKSTVTPHGIASDLFAMMADQENFIDLTLIRCYHKAHMNPHLDWLQSSTDLTDVHGFQSHHMATRFYIMEKDLRHIITSGHKMEDYHEAVARLPKDNSTRDADVERHEKKLQVFLNASHASLIKHFQRWIGSSLLPAVLMSERPIAQVVAAAILDKPMPKFESDPIVKNEMRLSGFIIFKISSA